MKLNKVYNEHEHASVSLKVMLLAFAVILVGALGYLVWDFQNSPDTTDYSSPIITKKTNLVEEDANVRFEPKEGWTNFADKEVGISFNYPKSWGWLVLEIISGDDTENVEGKTFNITIATTTQRSKSGAERVLPISMGGHSKDFRTTLGRGLGFSDYDTYKAKNGNYSVAHYLWSDGKIGTYRDVPVSSNPVEVDTANDKALVITDEWVDDSGYQYLADNSYGAIIPLSADSKYHAISLIADSELVSESDLLDFIKSFNHI